MNISKQLSMLPTYEGLNGQSVIGQGLIVKFTIEANSNFLKEFFPYVVGSISIVKFAKLSVFVSSDVHTPTTPSYLLRFQQQVYLLISYCQSPDGENKTIKWSLD